MLLLFYISGCKEAGMAEDRLMQSIPAEKQPGFVSRSNMNIIKFTREFTTPADLKSEAEAVSTISRILKETAIQGEAYDFWIRRASGIKARVADPGLTNLAMWSIQLAAHVQTVQADINEQKFISLFNESWPQLREQLLESKFDIAPDSGIPNDVIKKLFGTRHFMIMFAGCKGLEGISTNPVPLSLDEAAFYGASRHFCGSPKFILKLEDGNLAEYISDDKFNIRIRYDYKEVAADAADFTADQKINLSHNYSWEQAFTLMMIAKAVGLEKQILNTRCLVVTNSIGVDASSKDRPEIIRQLCDRYDDIVDLLKKLN